MTEGVDAIIVVGSIAYTLEGSCVEGAVRSSIASGTTVGVVGHTGETGVLTG